MIHQEMASIKPEVNTWQTPVELSEKHTEWLHVSASQDRGTRAESMQRTGYESLLAWDDPTSYRPFPAVEKERDFHPLYE